MIISFHVGPRRLKEARKMIEKLYFRLENIPLFVSDGLNFYKRALLETYGAPGKHKNPYDRRLKKPPKTVLPEELRYGQIIKTVKDGRVVNTERRVVFGEIDAEDITTSVIERLNLSFRQELNRFSRKTVGPSKNINHLTAHLSVYIRYYNLCRPHMAHKIGGIRYGTPAMAAGVTDRVWSLRELLLFPYRNYIN